MNRKIALFLILAFGISWGVDALIITGKAGQWAILLTMWGPGIAAVITSLWFNKSIKALGFGFKKPQYLLAGYLLPLLYAVPVYIAIWLFGFAGFNTGFNCSYLVLFTVGQIQHIIAAAGEEIGWRGFLYPQLSKNYDGFTAALVTGIIWAVWYYPLIINTYHEGPPLWYVLGCFSIMIIAVSFLAAWLRDKSGSIWPSVLLHASHNFYILIFLNNLTNPSPYRAYVYGESGIGLAVSTLVIAILLWLKHERSGDKDGSPPLREKQLLSMNHFL